MRPAGRGVQFFGLGRADWRSDNENAVNAQRRSGFIGAAIVATRTAGMRADAWVGGGRRAQRTDGTERRARRFGSIIATTSVRTGRGSLREK